MQVKFVYVTPMHYSDNAREWIEYDPTGINVNAIISLQEMTIYGQTVTKIRYGYGLELYARETPCWIECGCNG